jgi:hypothetical protein
VKNNVKSKWADFESTMMLKNVVGSRKTDENIASADDVSLLPK